MQRDRGKIERDQRAKYGKLQFKDMPKKHCYAKAKEGPYFEEREQRIRKLTELVERRLPTELVKEIADARNNQTD